VEIIYFVDHGPSATWLRPWCYGSCIEYCASTWQLLSGMYTKLCY